MHTDTLYSQAVPWNEHWGGGRSHKVTHACIHPLARAGSQNLISPLAVYNLSQPWQAKCSNFDFAGICPLNWILASLAETVALQVCKSAVKSQLSLFGGCSRTRLSGLGSCGTWTVEKPPANKEKVKHTNTLCALKETKPTEVWK